MAGLDAILHGGLLRNGLHVIAGPPGAGKTTLALQFLLQGAADGERTLYLTLSQSKQSLQQIAASHRLPLEGIDIQELASLDLNGLGADEQTLFHTSEVELRETVGAFLEAVERTRPSRIVFDSVAELRLLAGDDLRYRRQVLALRQLLEKQECTTVLVNPSRTGEELDPITDLTDCVITLQYSTPSHGETRRSLRVIKVRGAPFQSGNHSFVIRSGGLKVFPRLRVRTAGQPGQEKQQGPGPDIMASGITGLDELLGGGLQAGTSCLIIGPAGTGKSSLATAFAHSALERDERAAVFLFEERPELFLQRSAALGMDLQQHLREERLGLRLIDSGELSAGEFSHDVTTAADEGATVVMIDSLTSYYHAMPDESLLITQMHELLINLSQRGVLTLLTVAQHGVIGTGLHGPDVSYLADNLILLRHFEASGTLRKALAAVKQRYGSTRPSIREIHFSNKGIRVGGPLSDFQGVLSGTPRFEGDDSALLSVTEDEGGGGAGG